jgi:GT2 family glycosyltransferase
VGTAGSLAGTAHAALNLRRLRVPDTASTTAPDVAERVSVLLPVRDEVRCVRRCLMAVLASSGLADLEVLVLDDGSCDGTAELVAELATGDRRVRLLGGSDGVLAASTGGLPDGWLGKPAACARLARAATGSVLVFVDADVELTPVGLAATVRLLRSAGLDLVCPYPVQDGVTRAERLVQPLLAWSWMTTVPLRVAERSTRPSLAAANGQVLAVDAAVYRRCGGHAAPGVRGAVLEDIELLRAVKRAGGRGTIVDGTDVAHCRMYHGWSQLREGYAKSLWAAFGSSAGALAVAGAAAVVYVLPPLAMLAGSRAGAVGYAAAVTGRAMVTRRVGGRVWPDSLAHPASVVVFCALVVDSLRRHANGTLTWKGRALP